LYIYYNFTYNTKITKATGFMTNYLLLLYIPVTTKELPIRLLALVLSGILIMVLYYIIVGKKYSKGIIAGIKDGANDIVAEIDKLLKNENIEEDYKNLSKKLQALENKLLNTISKLTNIDVDLERRYAIFLFIKRLNSIFIKLNNQKIKNEEFLLFVKDLIINIGEISKSKEMLDSKLKEIESFELKIDSKNAYYIYNIFEDTKEALLALEAIKNRDFSYLGNKESFKKAYKAFYSKTFKNTELKSLRKIGSLKWNFALKSSIMLTAAYLVVTIFNLPEGKWLLFTIGVVSLPFAEQVNKKGRDRIIGTIIGVIAFDLIFTFIHYKPLLIVLVIISVFCMLSITDYSKKAIFITFMSLSMANFAFGDPFKMYYTLSLERLGFVLIGCFIPYIVSKIVPYKLKDKTEELKKDLVTLVYKMEESVKEKSMTYEERYKRIIKLSAIMKFTCNKLYFNNTQLNSKEIDQILRLENIFIMDVYYLIKNLKKDNFKLIDEEKEKVKRFIHLSEEEKKEKFYELSDNEKRLFLNLLNLKKSTEAMKKIIE
ncbi:MAG: FUSC family protein, partial [Clostridium sp.]|uniref:FUSC family protein n=1 Tax=Clostridium sp. TaxID=1506 RepID=UPI003F3D6078